MVPEKLTAFKVYRDDVDLIWVAEVELPEIEMLKETHSGSGIAGEVETPVLGHTGSLTLKMTFRVWTPRLTRLVRPQAQHLVFRGSLQHFDPVSGKIKPVAVKCMMQGLIKKASLGKAETGKQQDCEYEAECTYLKLTIDGEEQLEIDKYNYIFRIEGEDVLQEVREHLGLET